MNTALAYRDEEGNEVPKAWARVSVLGLAETSDKPVTL